MQVGVERRLPEGREIAIAAGPGQRVEALDEDPRELVAAERRKVRPPRCAVVEQDTQQVQRRDGGVARRGAPREGDEARDGRIDVPAQTFTTSEAAMQTAALGSSTRKVNDSVM